MNSLLKAVNSFANNARRKRADLFRQLFRIDKTTRILDIGSEDGTNIHNVLAGADYSPENIYIADLGLSVVRDGAEKFGFKGVVFDGSDGLPFADNSFDIVYCSSVIEHVNVKRSDVWKYRNGSEFAEIATAKQTGFAREIARIGRQYFVQTPAASFPLESHTLLPFAGYIPRRLLLPVVQVTNRVWIRSSEPDFHLLNERDLRKMLPDGTVMKETAAGMTKSFIVVRSEKR